MVLSEVSHLSEPNFLSKWLAPSCQINYLGRVTALVKNSLYQVDPSEKKELIAFADALIRRYSSDKQASLLLKLFDRYLRLERADGGYRHPLNVALLSKWKRAGQDEQIVYQFPEFAEFLDTSKLLSQLKVTRDLIEIVGGEPTLMVEGKRMTASEVMRRFSICHSMEFDSTFVVNTSGSVFTYLEGQGLQSYHPYLDAGTIPISRIRQDEEMLLLRKKASQFIRPEEAKLDQEMRERLNQERLFIVQVVTSRLDRGDANWKKVFKNPQHAYLRMVFGDNLPELGIRKGDVYEFGFYPKHQVCLPFAATQGRFCSPDLWEFISCKERYVTSILLSTDEAKRLMEYSLAAHRRNVQLGRELGFQSAQQNCAVFVRMALKEAGIHVPTELPFPTLVSQAAPTVLKQMGSQLIACPQALFSSSSQILGALFPRVVTQGVQWTMRTIHAVVQNALGLIAALGLAPLRTALGGFLGKGGDSFDPKDGPIVAPSRTFGNLFRLSSYHFNLPFVMQEWQKEQPSTEIYRDPVKFTIVPS